MKTVATIGIALLWGMVSAILWGKPSWVGPIGLIGGAIILTIVFVLNLIHDWKSDGV